MTLRAALQQAGWADCAAQALTPDASVRRYWRLTRTDGARAILMQDPGGAIPQFLKVGAQLDARDLSVPRVIQRADPFLLIEDFGDLSLASLSRDPDAETTAYACAGRVLARLLDGPIDLPRADTAYFLAGLAPFLQTTDLPDGAGLTRAMGALLQDHAGPPTALIHRDFHAENLFWLPDRTQDRRLGLLDFQDALSGPAGYDLASLVQDARRDVAPEAAEAARAAYLQASGQEAAALDRAVEVLGLVRNLRILGLFAQFAANGRPHYLRFVPRVRAHVRRTLQGPTCAHLVPLLPGLAG